MSSNLAAHIYTSHLGNWCHLNRDMHNVEAGLRESAAADGHMVPQAMVAVPEACVGAATI